MLIFHQRAAGILALHQASNLTQDTVTRSRNLGLVISVCSNFLLTPTLATSPAVGIQEVLAFPGRHPLHPRYGQSIRIFNRSFI